MEKKINLEEIVSKLASREFFEIYSPAIKNICLEFGKQILELAAENADWEATEDCVIVRGDIFIDKQSILNTINQVE